MPETVFMFSGQGSQYFHMGRALYDGNGTFREWMNRLDEVASQAAGTSVTAVLYSGAQKKGDLFDRTLLTHPAIFMVEYSLARCLIEAGVRPSLVLGASLGSFAAAAVAGFIDAGEALTAVIGQAKALEDCCEPGGMIAVLADPALFVEDFLSARSELAAINFSTHFVVSARQADLDGIEAALKRRAVDHQRLPVSFPFHSQWMDRAKASFQPFMRAMGRRQGQLPLVCCQKAAVLSELSDDYFWDVVRRPIRFRESAARVEQLGACRYIDVGPAGTLATFLKYGLPTTATSTVHSILTPFGFDQKNLAALLASVNN